jgi:hypothetical protein
MQPVYAWATLPIGIYVLLPKGSEPALAGRANFKPLPKIKL